MHSFLDVAEQVRDLKGAADADWPFGLGPRVRLPVPNEKALLLPADRAGYEPVDRPPREADAVLLGVSHRAARAALIGAPGLVVPLHRPSTGELVALGQDPAVARPTHNPRALATAVAIDLPHGRLWGVGKLVAIEGGLRPGSTLLIRHDMHWTDDPEDGEQRVAELLQNAANSVRAEPEPNAKPWRTVVVLLGDPPEGSSLPRAWKRSLELAAGVRAVRLRLRTSPDSSKATVIQDLRTTPPNALLVWDGGVASPPSYVQPYLAARSSGYTAIFGIPGDIPFVELLNELLMHLREVAPLVESNSPAEEAAMNWGRAAAVALNLAGPHLVFTDRATAMLDGNPYPDPGRMLGHLRRLAELARRYYDAKGKLGGLSLADVAIREHGIEVALKDKGLKLPRLNGFGNLKAKHHVKVDDFKSADKCGRIYFAVDKAGHRFVIDHVGLHNYGRA